MLIDGAIVDAETGAVAPLTGTALGAQQAGWHAGPGFSAEADVFLIDEAQTRIDRGALCSRAALAVLNTRSVST